MSEYNKGDRVKVTIEGTVERVESVRGDTMSELKISTEEQGRPCHYVYAELAGTEVEIIAPPARPYRVGDRVRSAHGVEWILGRDGYLVVKCAVASLVGTFHAYRDGMLETSFPTDGVGMELVEVAPC